MKPIRPPFLRLPLDERARQVAPLVRSGMRQKEIAAQQGVSEAQIVKCVRRARDLGLLPHKKRQEATSILSQVPLGRLWDKANQLDDKIQRWIVSNTPEGVTLADFAVACIVDSYHEEKNEYEML
jgi:transposase